MDGTIRDIHNYPLRLSRAIRHLLNNNKVSNENRLAILRFTAHMGVVERVCMARMTFYVPKLERLAELLGKNFVDATEDDIRSVVGKLNTMKVRFVRKKGEQVLVSDRTISGWTREGYKIALKRFFRWLRKKRKGHDPSETDWIEVKKIKTKIKASDLLSPDEALLLLRTRRGQHPRNRALILLLFETGARLNGGTQPAH
jgi:site-specific recombinase XerD